MQSSSDARKQRSMLYIYCVKTTYISDRASNIITPSPNSAISDGGGPDREGKQPRNSIMAAYRSSSSAIFKLAVGSFLRYFYSFS